MDLTACAADAVSLAAVVHVLERLCGALDLRMFATATQCWAMRMLVPNV
jgi:hypothetical protein